MNSPIAMAFLAAAALGVQPAAAQLAKNPKAPVDVVADNFEMHNSECVGVYTGSAEASQDTSRLRADKMTIHLEVKKNKPGGAGPVGGSSCGDMLSLEANGSVYYVSSDGRRIHGDHGFYDAPSTTITVTGDVTAVDGQNVMRGTKMVYNTQTGDGHVEGGGKGPGAKNRPRGVFYPKDTNDQGASTTATSSSSSSKSKKAPK